MTAGATPTFSVIMPAYNAAATIDDAIASVQAQTRADWELIVIDDASQDATHACVAARADADPRLRLLTREHNGGAGRARNAGIKAARGRYIAFLDSDDQWYPHKLAVQAQALAATNTALCYAGYNETDRQGRIARRIAAPPRTTYRDLLRGCPIGCLTAVYDTARVGKLYMPELRLRQDCGLWLRILTSGEVACGLPQVLAIRRRRSGSLTANKLVAARYMWHLLRQEAGLAPWSAAYGVVRHMAAAAARRYSPGRLT